jgi:hypothetical protein
MSFIMFIEKSITCNEAQLINPGAKSSTIYGVM